MSNPESINQPSISTPEVKAPAEQIQPTPNRDLAKELAHSGQNLTDLSADHLDQTIDHVDASADNNTDASADIISVVDRSKTSDQPETFNRTVEKAAADRLPQYVDIQGFVHSTKEARNQANQDYRELIS